MWQIRQTASIVVAAAVVAAPLYVHADAKAQAGVLYKEGVELFKAKKFAAARAKFQAAYNIDPAQNLLYNLARAAEEMGDASAAVGHYKAYIARFPKAVDREEVKRRVRVLEAVLRTANIGTLAVKNLPATAKLEIDEKPAPQANSPGQWRLKVGEHTIKVVEPGKPPVTQKVSVSKAQTTTFDYGQFTSPKTDPKAADPKSTKPVDPKVVDKTVPTDPPEDGFWNGMTIAGLSLAGTGAVVMGVSGVFFAKATGNADDYNNATGTSPAELTARQQAKDDFESNGSTATWMLIGGTVMLVGGLGLLATDYIQRDGWAVVPTGNGFGIVGTF